MRIIEINALENGGHRNQTWSEGVALPEGYAKIPDNMETKNFPFGEVTVKNINGIMTVTKWNALPIPESNEPEPITTQERLAALEAAMLEMAMGGTE